MLTSNERKMWPAAHQKCQLLGTSITQLEIAEGGTEKVNLMFSPEIGAV